MAGRAGGGRATLLFHVADGQSVEFDDKVRGRQPFATSDIGDFIIRRSDGTPAFFFFNAIDDALMGVPLVLRGEDHLTNTPRQILLLKTLGLPVPEYAHIALVVGSDGAPLSKRGGSRAGDLRRAARCEPRRARRRAVGGRGVLRHRAPRARQARRRFQGVEPDGEAGYRAFRQGAVPAAARGT